MKEEPRLFKFFHEIESRPCFDANASVTLTNFESLVGEYHFHDEVKCQVNKSDGNCGHMHQRGWLGKIKEGKEGLIGGHCASKYFKADKNFAIEKNRVRREINISNYMERLTELLKDRSAFIAQVDTEVDRLIFVRDSVRYISKALPDRVVQVLKDMSKTGNRAIGIQVQYEEKDENGRTLVEWVDQSIGSISGVKVWEASLIQDTLRKLREIRDAAQAVKITKDAGEKKLKGWLDTLSELSRCVARIDDFEKDHDNFATFDNVRKLCFLVRNHQEQSEIARYALRYDGHESPSIDDGKNLLHDLNAEVRKAFGNRNFRVT